MQMRCHHIAGFSYLFENLQWRDVRHPLTPPMPSSVVLSHENMKRELEGPAAWYCCFFWIQAASRPHAVHIHLNLAMACRKRMSRSPPCFMSSASSCTDAWLMSLYTRARVCVLAWADLKSNDERMRSLSRGTLFQEWMPYGSPAVQS